MIEAAKAEPGNLILVVLGPLTNVALACKLDPQLPSRGELHHLDMLLLCTGMPIFISSVIWHPETRWQAGYLLFCWTAASSQIWQ